MRALDIPDHALAKARGDTPDSEPVHIGPSELRQLANLLSPKARKAWVLWRQRRWDTQDIAGLLNLPESIVANFIAAHRQAMRGGR